MGAVGYGGPLALVALMEKECCGRLKWISSEVFTELFVYCKLLPGPVAYQMSLAVGHHLRGRWGGVLAGVALLLPATILILLISVFYAQFRAIPNVALGLAGFRAAALVILVDSSWRLFKPFRSDKKAWVYIVAAIAGMWFLPRWEPLLIVGGGLIAVLLSRRVAGLRSYLWPLFWVHFKAGAMVFGTGLAIVPVLEREVVHHYQWMSSSEFLDGLAFGQITPGPITISSVFIGYRVASYLGAFSALFGMYLPGIGFVLFLLPALRKTLAQKAWLQHFQSGAVPTVVGCIVGATFLLARTTLTESWMIGVFIAVCGILWGLKAPAWLVVPLGAGLAYVARLL